MNGIKDMTEFFGLTSSYVDKMGISHKTNDNVREAFLQSLNYTNDKILLFKDFLWRRGILPTISFFESDEKFVDVYIPDMKNYNFEYRLFDLEKCVLKGKVKKYKVIEKKIIDKVNYVRVRLKIDLPGDFGYYDMEINVGDRVLLSHIIKAPDYCYFPKSIEKSKKKLFGLGVQLYSLRSKSDMGAGDFGALKKLIMQVSKAGCDFVGLNPLGVMYKDSVFDVSPYRVLSREYINYLYIDLAGTVEFKKSEAVQKYISTTKIKNEIKILRDSDIVDYKRTLNLKLSILKKMYKYFCENDVVKNNARAKRFLKFKTDEKLINLCLFETLLEGNDAFWQNWDLSLKNITPAIREKLILKHKRRIDFYSYCHFVAEEQLSSVVNLCKKCKMKIGLYLDMPVGAASNGVEVWQNQDAFAINMDIGTPPDTIRPKGQTWGLCPLKPFDLKNDYGVFINLIRKTMQYAGAIRIDHALGLMRLFWVNSNGKGAYVNYDLKDMIAIICIESNKYKCVVVGEDLGNVPDGFREYIGGHKLLLNKILFRQKDKDGEFLSTKKYPYFSLSQVSTHDQATSCGFWVASDIEANETCNLYPKKSQYEDSLFQRQREREAFVRALKRQNCFYENEAEFKKYVNGESVPVNLEYSFNMYGAKTSSCFYMIRLEDVFRQVAMQNVPSTVDEYPNWRIKMPVAVEDLEKYSGIKKFFRKVRDCRL